MSASTSCFRRLIRREREKSKAKMATPTQELIDQFGLHQDAGRDVWMQSFRALADMMVNANTQIAALGAQVTAMNDRHNNDLTRITILETKAEGAGGPKVHDKTKMDLAEWKSFGALTTFDGDEKSFSDWEFKLQTFVRPLRQFEAYLDWVKERDEEISVETWQGMKGAVDWTHGDGMVKLDWYDDQLFSVLSLLCTGSALASVKNVREEYGVRGAKAYWKIMREVASKSGVRLERLADIVHHPKQITDYKVGKQMLEHWEAKRKELEKIEGQPLSDLTKRTTLKKMLPADLLRDLERDRTLKDWSSAWNFVLEQIPLRRDWGKKQQGGHAMDLDVVEKEAPPSGWGEDDYQCLPCGEGEQALDTLKGGAKGGTFEGNCSFCGAYGHKRAECRKYTAYLQSMGKGGKGNLMLGDANKGAEKGQAVVPYNKGFQPKGQKG